jgi:hypothetical protein
MRWQPRRQWFGKYICRYVGSFYKVTIVYILWADFFWKKEKKVAHIFGYIFPQYLGKAYSLISTKNGFGSFLGRIFSQNNLIRSPWFFVLSLFARYARTDTEAIVNQYIELSKSEHTLKLSRHSFFGQQPLVTLLLPGPSFFPIILFRSTTLLMVLKENNRFFCYGSNSMPLSD